MNILNTSIRIIGIVSLLMTGIGYGVAIFSYAFDRSGNPQRSADRGVVPANAGRGPWFRRGVIIIATLSLTTLAIDSSFFVWQTTHIPHNANATATPYVSHAAYDFEDGTEGWTVTEAGQKPATLNVTTRYAMSGTHALEVDAPLAGEASPGFAALPGIPNAYTHTEAVVFFDAHPPAGRPPAATYDLSGGAQVTCFVYIPHALTVIGPFETFVRIFVKDSAFANSYSTYINIDAAHVDRWFAISLTVGDNPDAHFNASQVHGLGVRLETPTGSTLAAQSPWYIDDCTIQG